MASNRPLIRWWLINLPALHLCYFNSPTIFCDLKFLLSPDVACIEWNCFVWKVNIFVSLYKPILFCLLLKRKNNQFQPPKNLFLNLLFVASEQPNPRESLSFHTPLLNNLYPSYKQIKIPTTIARLSLYHHISFSNYIVVSYSNIIHHLLC